MVSDLAQRINDAWWDEHTAALSDFVAIPSISPAFDPTWAGSGHLSAIVDRVADWCLSRDVLPGLRVHRLTLAGRTPLLIVDIPAHDPSAHGANQPTVLVYGHLDVQPPGGGWTVTQPFVAALRDSQLYGRGTGDDKYAPIAAVAAVEALQTSGRSHPHVIVLLETSEESSSVDLPAHLDAYGDLLGKPDLIICLDTFVPDTATLWHSTSMRGIIVADLSVAVASEGMHSGLAGGIAASSFRILRTLLDRLEDSGTGACLLPQLHTNVPATHLEALARQASTPGRPSDELPLLPTVRPTYDRALDQLLAQSWAPSVAYVGVDGVPATTAAGSVLRPETTVRLSIRLPPTVPAAEAAEALRTALEADPPYGADVRLTVHGAQNGWSTVVDDDLLSALDRAGAASFGRASSACGGGATIPPLGILAHRFPSTPVLPLGVVTASSHPHGPDEHLDIAAAARLTTAIATLFSELSVVH